jgi:hypothetical protein
MESEYRFNPARARIGCLYYFGHLQYWKLPEVAVGALLDG